jgi:Ca-activated chloride channel family protein
MGCLLFLLCAGATAQETRLDDRPGPGSPFLLRGTDVHATVVGPVAHVEVEQRWENPNPFPVDGLYIFPLPEDAAVNDMELRIGERTIRADMKRRDEARQIYEQARREGRVAGLLDQERPNVFAQSVANIMPGMAVEVTLSFDHPIECEDGGCEYVFPTVVGPRFIPAHQTDPGRIDPPVIPEGEHTPQTLRLFLSIDAGVPIRDVSSPSHRVIVGREDETRAHVSLDAESASRLDRDFRLRWKVGGGRPELGVLAFRDPEGPGDPGTFTLILQPPASVPDAEAVPRELVFVLDCSGSMSGVPLEAAKSVVRGALAGVRPGDTFQILRFSESASGLAPAPLTPTPGNLLRARTYLESLRGQGGTQMIEGIRAALDRPADPERLRIVSFLTDGYIGNEAEILAEVQRKLGDARLFSFGIGSSVNRYLLEGLAEEGRGAAAFLGSREKPDEMVERFLHRIDAPVLTDIRLSFEDVDVQDLEPGRIPDLFAGQTLLIHGRYTKPGTGLVVVEGRRRGRNEVLSRVLVLPDREEDHDALGRLWARARIHRLERQLHAGPDPAVQEAITVLGLRHRLMTPWTSLVAVDSEVANPAGGSVPVDVPVEMPLDVSYEGVFGAAGSAGHKAMLTMAAAPPPAQGTVGFAQRLRMEGDAMRDRAQVAAELEEEPGRQDVDRMTALSFDRISLIREDGTRVVLEADGELWVVDGRRRTKVRNLTAAELGEVGRLLAGAGGWHPAVAAARQLVVEGPSLRGAIALPSTDGDASRLAALLEQWSR